MLVLLIYFKWEDVDERSERINGPCNLDKNRSKFPIFPMKTIAKYKKSHATHIQLINFDLSV